MLNSLNNNTKYLHFFLSVTLEVFMEEVSFLICVFLMQTQVSGREAFCSRSSSRPAVELQVGSSLPNRSPATNQGFHNLYGCSSHRLWSIPRLYIISTSCYFSTSPPSHQHAGWVQLIFGCVVPKLYNPFTCGEKIDCRIVGMVSRLDWERGLQVKPR